MPEDAAPPTTPTVDPLPAGTHLIHIGPPKTGSTALQTALHRHRDALAGHGAIYPGARRKFSGQFGLRPIAVHEALDVAELESWQRLRAAVAEAGEAPGARVVVVSREGLARMSGRRVEELVRDVGGEQPHVVAVGRRLDRLLPSYWQQRVKRIGVPLDLDDYAAVILGEAPAPPPEDEPALPGSAESSEGMPSDADRHRAMVAEEHGGFWAAYDLPALVRRWTDVTGPGRFTLLVPPAGDRDLLPDALADLLGVPRELTRDPVGVANDSLTRPEIEAVLALNQHAYRERWSRARRNAFVRESVVRSLVLHETPPGQEQIPPLAGAMLDRLREVAEQQVAGLEALTGSGALRVVGDLDALRIPGEPSGSDVGPAPTTLPLESAAAALEAAVVMAARRLDAVTEHAAALDDREPAT